jgi:hypothetical protein
MTIQKLCPLEKSKGTKTDPSPRCSRTETGTKIENASEKMNASGTTSMRSEGSPNKTFC